jgi:hypothetical protein
MPPRPRGEPRDQQLLVRLNASDHNVLRAIAHLEGMTPNAYAHQLLTGHLARLRSHPRVIADLANRRAYAAESSHVVPLRGSAETSKPLSSTDSEAQPTARE